MPKRGAASKTRCAPARRRSPPKAWASAERPLIPLLHVGPERTTIAEASLALGWRSIARDHFKHDPPSPLEMENAIAAVEDEVGRAHNSVAKGATLLTRDPAIREIALAAGVPPSAEVRLALDAVEQTFQRLAAGAHGLPAGRDFAATLLILRELMHHLDFSSILIEAGQAMPSP